MTWYRAFHPTVLILIGSGLACTPYVLWLLGYERPTAYNFEVSYVPAIALAFFCLMFAMGAVICRNAMQGARRPTYAVKYHIRGGILAPMMVLAILIPQAAMVVVLHGTAPILSFLSGYDVDAVNEAQRSSEFGQLGIFLVTVFLLNAVLALLLGSSNPNTSTSRFIYLVIFVVAAIAAVLQGKRQLIGMFLVFFMYVSTVRTGNPHNLILSRFGVRELSSFGSVIWMVVLLMCFVLLFGLMGNLRLGEGLQFEFFDSLEQLINYLSLPLINFEGVVAQFDYGLGQGDFFGIFQGLVPYKIREEYFGVQAELPRLELTCGAGLVGGLYWYSGASGLMSFGILFGYLSNALYLRAKSSLFAMLAYAQIVWSLLNSHTYNHFFELGFFLGPLVCYYILVKVVITRDRS